ncbi:MAG: DUF4336 domain-containing protein [Planctomycetota bacterium]|jgi:hypothetical protein
MLQRLADDFWEVHHPLKLLRIFPLGHRMLIIRQSDGALQLHSPVPLTDQLAEKLDSLGRVRHILAPSLMHNLFLEEYQARYPQACFWAAPGFAERYPDLRVDVELGPGAELEGLQCCLIEGMPKVNECVVFHEATRSLIVADLVFNFPKSDSRALRILLRLFGAYGGVACSRLLRLMVKDKKALRASLERVYAWDFERLIPGHGEVLASGAKSRLRAAYSWLEKAR